MLLYAILYHEYFPQDVLAALRTSGEVATAEKAQLWLNKAPPSRGETSAFCYRTFLSGLCR